jgi:hypothetical protein
MPMKILTPRLLLAAALACLLAPHAALAAGSIRATASPNVLLADGNSSATVTAEVRGSNGRPARDGTEVRFYTTAGTITQIAFTSAGVARATLRSSSVPQAANISISAGVDQTVLTIPMVSKLVETNVGGRVLRISGKYVAFSEDKHLIQADEQVKVKFRGVTVEANSVQLDITTNSLKAIGKVQIASDDKTLVGERLWLNLRTFEGYVMAVGTRKWFSAYGLTDLPERPKDLNPSFDLVDMTDSQLIWVSKQANYIIDERVQIQGARAYVGGVKTLRMPFHQAGVGGHTTESDQYVGLGSEGLTLDVPLYIRMTPGSSTAFHLGYGARATGGLGYFSREQGLSLDLVQKYGFAGASEGEAMFTNLTSIDRWGFNWTHNQQINKTTRMAANLQFPEHRDLYGGFNLTTGLPIGTLQASITGQKTQLGPLAKTLSFGFESKPRPIADGKVNLSFEATSFTRDQTLIRRDQTIARTQFTLPSTSAQALGIRARPKLISIRDGLTLESSAALRMVKGSGTVQSGFGPSFETNLRQKLPHNGTLAVGLNYNDLAGLNDIFATTGKMNATFNANYPVTKKFRVSAFGSMALDAPSRNSIFQASYEFAPKWRLDVLHSMFQFGTQNGAFGATDFQFGISRALGNREASIYWSRQEHKFLFEFGGVRF